MRPEQCCTVLGPHIPVVGGRTVGHNVRPSAFTGLVWYPQEVIPLVATSSHLAIASHDARSDDARVGMTIIWPERDGRSAQQDGGEVGTMEERAEYAIAGVLRRVHELAESGTAKLAGAHYVLAR